VAIAALIYLPVLIDLLKDWYEDSNYSHGFLIIPISGWLLWRMRPELAGVAIRSSTLGFVGVLVALAIFILGTAGAEYFSVRFSFVLLLASLTLYLLGPVFFRKTWFAFFFLLFMIPIPYVIYYSMTFPMQLFASKIASVVLGLIGLPLMRLGNVLYLPGGQALEVAEACSGLRSIMSLLALGALFSYFTQPSRSKAVVLFLSTVPIAILGNVVRILFTTIGTYAISEKFVEGTLHEIAGMIVFVFSMVMLVIVGALLKWKELPVDSISSSRS
jgi:exosortase